MYLTAFFEGTFAKISFELKAFETIYNYNVLILSLFNFQGYYVNNC